MKRQLEKKIGWQKYEDVLENQLASPIVRLMMEQAMQHVEENNEESEVDAEISEAEDGQASMIPIITVSNDLAHDAALATNFDCWLGHTNFEITPTTFAILEEIEGVEILKICSRYRFFIGIGKMFKFKNVRKDLENQILE